MISIENCTVVENATNYQVVANEGFLLYRKDRMQAYEAYKANHANNPQEYPRMSILTFFRFTHSVYLPLNNNGENYATITAEQAEALINE